MKYKTPISALTLTGVESNTAEAVLDLSTSVSGKSAVDLKENHSDLSQLPDQMPEVRKTR